VLKVVTRPGITDLTDIVKQFAHRFAAPGLGALHRFQFDEHGVDLGHDVSDRVLHAVDATLEQNELLAGRDAAAVAVAAFVVTHVAGIGACPFDLVVLLSKRHLSSDNTTFRSTASIPQQPVYILVRECQTVPILLQQEIREVAEATTGTQYRNHHHQYTNTGFFSRAVCPSYRPTNTDKALKAYHCHCQIKPCKFYHHRHR